MTRTELFSTSDLLTKAWKDYKENFWFFVSIVAIIFGVQIFLGAVEQSAGRELGIVASLISIIVSAIIGAGVTRVMLQFIDGKGAHFDNIIPPAQNVLWYFIFQIIMTCVIVGLIFLFVLIIGLSFAMEMIAGDLFRVDSVQAFIALFGTHLGTHLALFGAFLVVLISIIAYVSIRFMFTTYVIVDKNLNTFAAMRASSILTKGIKWRLAGLLFIMIVINIIGMIPLMLGLIVTIPVTFIVLFRVYRYLCENLRRQIAHDKKTKGAEEKETVPGVPVKKDVSSEGVTETKNGTEEKEELAKELSESGEEEKKDDKRVDKSKA